METRFGWTAVGNQIEQIIDWEKIKRNPAQRHCPQTIQELLNSHTNSGGRAVGRWHSKQRPPDKRLSIKQVRDRTGVAQQFILITVLSGLYRNCAALACFSGTLDKDIIDIKTRNK